MNTAMRSFIYLPAKQHIVNNDFYCIARSVNGQDESDNAAVVCLLRATRRVQQEKKIPESHIINRLSFAQACSVKIYILLTKHEGRTGRISAQGLDSTDRAQRGPYKKDRGPIFSQYGPEQAWLRRDLLHD